VSFRGWLSAVVPSAAVLLVSLSLALVAAVNAFVASIAAGTVMAACVLVRVVAARVASAIPGDDVKMYSDTRASTRE